MEDMHLSLEYFDGPLSLLLNLIEKNDIDIYDIEIFTITEQFLAYLENCKKNKVELASEFVLMASTLLEIKARMLLPNSDKAYKDTMLLNEEDPRYDLMQRLIEYKQFKKISVEFEKMYENFEGRRSKIKKTYKIENKALSLNGIDPFILREIYQKMLLKMPLVDDTRIGFFESIHRDTISLEDKTEDILTNIKKIKKASFFDLVEDEKSLEEIVVSFLSILNLMKDRLINASQDVQYGEINLEYVGDWFEWK